MQKSRSKRTDLFKLNKKIKINFRLTIFLLFATKNGWTELIKVSCDYREPKTCLIKDLKLKLNDQVSIINSNRTVEMISIYDSQIPCFPCGIDNFYSNAKVISIHNSTLRQISFQDFKNFSSLKNINLKKNKIGKSNDKYNFSEKSVNIILEDNLFYFENSKHLEQNSYFLHNIVTFVLVSILIGTNAAFIIKLRKKSKIKLMTKSETELTVLNYEEINKSSILNPFNEIKHENMYNEDKNYEELVYTKPKNDEDFYAEIPICKEQNEKKITEESNDLIYSKILK